MMVSSTGSSHTYNYHKATLKEADLLSLSNDINDFAARYRVNNGEPSSNNDEGDLVFDTNADVVKVYNGSAWKEVASTGEFKFLVLTNQNINAAQLLISVNGVIQKPNSGTNPSGLDGFVLSASDEITFCSAPPNGADVFVTLTGSEVSIPTPGDGTVSAAKIASGAVTTAKLADGNVTTAKIASDAVTAAKIGDDVINSEHIAAGAVDLEHMSSESVDEDNLYISNAGSNGQFLQKQSGNNGGLTWADADTTSLMPLAGGTFTGDVTFDNGTNAGKDMMWDESNNSLEFTDEVKASFGTGEDLKIYADGSNSVIAHNGDGDLQIGALGTNEKVRFTSDVYFDNGTHDGYDISWDESAKTFEFDDDVKCTFGNGSDLSIYHNATDSYLDNDNGDLYIRTTSSGDDVIIQAVDDIFIKPQAGESGIEVIGNGGVKLYYDDAKKLETVTGGTTITGVCTATSFAGDGSNLTGISAGGATGGSSDEVFWENGQTVTANYTITNNKNAMSAGPITINNGVTVTIGDGETWTIV